MPRRKRPKAVAGRPRYTGPSQATKDALWERAGGRCEVCGKRLDVGAPFSRHHRLPRRMGGTSNPAINTLPNLLLLCGSATTPEGCHQEIEVMRSVAYGFGYLLRDGQDPAEQPAVIRSQLRWLTRDGQYADRPEAA